MKTLLVFLACAYICSCAPASPENVVPIVSEEFDIEQDGKFHYSYEGGDGTKVSGQGESKQIDPEHAIETIQGSYEYTDPEGHKVAVQYIANENGYQPVGDSIPQAPEYIARAAKYIAEHPDKDAHQIKTAIL